MCEFRIDREGIALESTPSGEVPTLALLVPLGHQQCHSGMGLPVSEDIMRQKTGTIPTPAAAEVSSYMRSLAEKRWKLYAERVACGEISAENYVYKPRGPLPWNLKTERDLKRWERQIANAQLVRFALEGRKLSRREIERMVQATRSPRRSRLHLRFGGQPPRYWSSVHYDRLIKHATKGIRAELGLDAEPAS
jgi:hypothetical protein